MTWDVDAVLKLVGAFGGTATLLATVVWPRVRARLERDNARDKADADYSRGRSNWIKRAHDELADKEADIKLLHKALRDRDETIAELRLREAVHNERDSRARRHVQLLQLRLRRFGGEDDDAWMSTDNGPLGPPEV